MQQERRGERLRDYHTLPFKVLGSTPEKVCKTIQEVKRACTVHILIAQERYEDLSAYTETWHPRFEEEIGFITLIKNSDTRVEGVLTETNIELLIPANNHPLALEAVETIFNRE